MSTGGKIGLLFLGIAAAGGITYAIIKSASKPQIPTTTTVSVSDTTNVQHNGLLGFVKGALSGLHISLVG